MPDHSITSLIEKLEGAEVGSRELDALIYSQLACTLIPRTDPKPRRRWPDGSVTLQRRVTTSLDAALALAERVLDQRGPININICLAGSAQVVIDSVGPCDPVMTQVVARTPALALCAATLRAQSEARV